MISARIKYTDLNQYYSKTSPHYLYRKYVGATNENLYFDITVQELFTPLCFIYFD